MFKPTLYAGCAGGGLSRFDRCSGALDVFLSWMLRSIGKIPAAGELCGPRARFKISLWGAEELGVANEVTPGAPIGRHRSGPASMTLTYRQPSTAGL